MFECNTETAECRRIQLPFWDSEYDNDSNPIAVALKMKDETFVAQSYDFHAIRIFTLQNGKKYCDFSHENTVSDMDFLHSHYLVSGSVDRSVRIWDTEKCSEILRFQKRG